MEKKSKIYFLISDDVIHGRLLMTSHKSETTPVRLPIRHMTSITWRHQCEISRDEIHYSRKNGNWASVIFGKKIQTRFGTSGSVIYGKKSQKRLFRVIWREKISFQNFRILGTELASFLEKKSRRIFQCWINTALSSLTLIFKPMDFFSKNDASSVPGFSGVMTYITWYLTLMTSRDLGHMTYR